METTPRLTNPLRLTQVLFYVNAAVWVLLGIIALWRLNVGGVLTPISAIMIGMLMFGNAFILLLAGVGLAERTRLTYIFALLILVVNIVLAFTDQIGLFDLLTLLLDLVILGFMIIFRKQFWTQ